MNKKNDTVIRIRQFNRFYTALIGTLNKNFLGSDYSVTETRILFELISNDCCSANDLVEKLNIDKSYMSRIMKSFEKNHLITKQVSPGDRRSYIINLTDIGIKETEKLIAETNNQINNLIKGLSLDECNEVCSAMDTITYYLSNKNKPKEV